MDLSQSFGSGFFGFSVVLALRVLVFLSRVWAFGSLDFT